MWNMMDVVAETQVQSVTESVRLYLRLPEEEAMSHDPLFPGVAQNNDSNGNS